MKLTAFFAITSIILSASTLHGQNIVVGWGGDTVSGSTDLNNFTTQTSVTGVNVNPPSRAGRLIVPPGTDNLSADAIIGIPFSESTQLSPLSGYTGQLFYGGLSSSLLNNNAPPSVDRAQVSNQGPNDILDFRYALNSTQHDSRLAIFFDKTDFLAGGSTQPVKLGASSTFSIRFNSNTSNQVNNDGELRWLVREGGQWWVSAANAAGQPNIRSQDDAGGANGIKNQTTFTTSYASGQLDFWAPFDPVTGGGLVGLNFEPGYTSRFVVAPGTNPFIAKSFTDLTAIGFYIEGDQFSTNVFQMEVETITFNVLVVPEPSTYCLIALMGLGYGAFRQYRQKQPQAQPTEPSPSSEPDVQA